jgi:hypothetical protein
MKTVLRIGLCCALYGGLCGDLMAQRGGGGHGGGGGGFHGGGGIGGGVRGGSGIGGGVRGGFGGYGYGRGFGYGYGRGFYGGYGYPYGGYGYDPWFGYWDDPYYSSYPSTYSSPYQYNVSPNVSVIYPAAPQTQAVYSAPAQPVMRTYDQYGQEVRQPAPSSGGSPIYLIATKDQVIRAAASYWVDGNILHYVTLQREEKQVPLDSLDRSLTLQLNRERRVPIQLPQ